MARMKRITPRMACSRAMQEQLPITPRMACSRVMQEQLPITPRMACSRAMQEQLPSGVTGFNGVSRITQASYGLQSNYFV